MTLLFTLPVYAQREGEGIEALFTGTCCIFWILLIAVNIACLVWVVRDAQARGASAGAWIIIVLLFGVLGLLAYLVARPRGKLVECPECGRKKPIGDGICPHCGRRVV